MPRTASATGSLWSSPSTSTVKSPVIVPSPVPGPGALQETRQFGEDRRRVTFGGRRLAGGKSDLSLRHCESGDRIHQHQHVAALVTEIFRDGQRQICSLAAQQRRFVRGGDHDDGAGKAVRTEVVLNEFLHFAAALADQTDHGHVGRDVAGEHRQQHRFADAGTGENAQPLAAAAGHEGIERPHAEVERSTNAPPGMGWWRCIAERRRRRTGRKRTLAVDRLAHGIDDASEPADRGPHRIGRRGHERPAPPPYPVERGKRHQQCVARRKILPLRKECGGPPSPPSCGRRSTSPAADPAASTMRPRTPTTRP